MATIFPQEDDLVVSLARIESVRIDAIESQTPELVEVDIPFTLDAGETYNSGDGELEQKLGLGLVSGGPQGFKRVSVQFDFTAGPLLVSSLKSLTGGSSLVMQIQNTDSDNPASGKISVTYMTV